MRILVTGATGFIGSFLVDRLAKENLAVVAAVRNSFGLKLDSSINLIDIGNLTSSLDWGDALRGVDVVVHLAARAHILRDPVSDPLAHYRYINVDCSLNLAHQAVRAGVKRFIYMSSIKVNGESTVSGKPFSSNDNPMPEDFYGISKYEAEIGLQGIAKDQSMELVIIRPPLVYGPGVKGNFLNLMKWMMRPLPLPFSLINSLRSYVSLENLVDFIITCIYHPRAANQVFLVSDDKDLSIVDLCYLIGRALARPAMLFSIPVSWIYFFANLMNRQAVADRLCLSLQVDITDSKRLLGWAPKITPEEAINETARYFLSKNNKP